MLQKYGTSLFSTLEGRRARMGFRHTSPKIEASFLAKTLLLLSVDHAHGSSSELWFTSMVTMILKEPGIPDALGIPTNRIAKLCSENGSPRSYAARGYFAARCSHTAKGIFETWFHFESTVLIPSNLGWDGVGLSGGDLRYAWCRALEGETGHGQVTALRALGHDFFCPPFHLLPLFFTGSPVFTCFWPKATMS